MELQSKENTCSKRSDRAELDSHKHSLTTWGKNKDGHSEYRTFLFRCCPINHGEAMVSSLPG